MSTGDDSGVTGPPRDDDAAVPRRAGRYGALWGAVGSLLFLVLHQGYLLFGGRFLGFVPVAAVTLAVGSVVGGVAYGLVTRTTGNGQR